MATVYLAHDLRHDRRVAIKVLRPELAAVIGAERGLVEIFGGGVHAWAGPRHVRRVTGRSAVSDAAGVGSTAGMEDAAAHLILVQNFFGDLRRVLR